MYHYLVYKDNNNNEEVTTKYVSISETFFNSLEKSSYIPLQISEMRHCAT